MNNPDFEKTQIWAKNLINTPMPKAPSAAEIPSVVPPVLPQKPVMKQMSKEEKIMLATGGALAIGLGIIVITSLSDDDTARLSAAKTDLVAPKLDLGTEPVHTPAQDAVSVSMPKPTIHHQPVQVKEEHHAASAKPDLNHPLLQIPEVPEIASGIDDKVSFLEAFQAARAEVGPAGLFAWRDTYYSTFTDKEWESVPESQKENWLLAVQPIIDPDHTPEPVIDAAPHQDFQHVVVAERGEITWTGIDKDGDGKAEILMARINGQSPMVLMDTDGDGILDTRYDYQASTGKTFASEIQPFSMTTAEIEKMEYTELQPDMGFYNNSENKQISEALPVSITEDNSEYIIMVDSNQNNIVDTITFLTDDNGPVVGLDYDNDGQIEMGYVYNSENQTVSASEVEPMEEMKFIGPEQYQYTSLEDAVSMDAVEFLQHENLAGNDDNITDDDPYADLDSGSEDDYINA